MSVNAVILPNAILDQASAWRDESIMRWSERGDKFMLIGDACLVSPVDNRARVVRLMLARNFQTKGKAIPTLRSLSGEIVGDGYTICLNRELIVLDRDPLMAILLHEIVHSVDPYFDEDVRRQETEGRLDGEDLYALPSEQRAFTAMWTDSLREDLAAESFDLDVTLRRYADCCREFDFFCCYCLLAGGDLRNQTRAHFSTIVAALRKRATALQA